MCGVLAGDKELIGKVRKLHGVLGGVIDPHAAYMLIRGLKTLHLRVAQHNKNAQAIAEYLDKHPVIEKVHYPSLSHHRDHGVATRGGAVKMFPNGFGG
eukprot:CAMPEP_0184322184 /NCGR_PEP_ID=MMETSP1049-20130417/123314_1 /TAXON_ID=77928 /ORGANISM="Proteomonas sulcata, Strain CCMP704" /LENGTH=97 /DNA_ID=CAMNT_0026643235 /DNA_START=15 /DNA_END=304 /DNA_ORIENTATION=+